MTSLNFVKTSVAIENAIEFMRWYREMNIRGEIKVSPAALAIKPCNDYNLREALEMLKEDRNGLT